MRNSFLILVLFALAVGCSAPQPMTTTSETEADLVAAKLKNYPPSIRYQPASVTELKNKVKAFQDFYQCRYDVIELDTLLSCIKTIQYGYPVAKIIEPLNTGLTIDEAKNGIMAFFDQWGDLFNVKSSELNLIEAKDETEFFQYTFRKNFPAGNPVVNSEFNEVTMIVSKSGELGYLSCSNIPSATFPDIGWIDPEQARKSLIQHKISYQKFNRQNIYVIQELGAISGGERSAIVLARRIPGSADFNLTPANVELNTHLAWVFAITPSGKSSPSFRVYVDAFTGDILDSFYLEE